MSLFVWAISFDLSGLGDPASSYATAERRITLRVKEEVFNFKFTGAKETSANLFCDLGLCPFIPKLNTRQQLLIKVTATQRISPRGA